MRVDKVTGDLVISAQETKRLKGAGIERLYPTFRGDLYMFGQGFECQARLNRPVPNFSGDKQVSYTPEGERCLDVQMEIPRNLFQGPLILPCDSDKKPPLFMLGEFSLLISSTPINTRKAEIYVTSSDRIGGEYDGWIVFPITERPYWDTNEYGNWAFFFPESQ